MAKINQIQNSIAELDGGAFQKLADSYLARKGYDQINPIGSVIGKNKTKVGTPDTLIPMANGKYVFAEYTTIKQEKIFAKFNDDIDKCFDEDKTKIPVDKIDEIVLCYTSQLSTDEIEKLRIKCESKSVNLNLFGISSISYDLLEKYPGMAKDYLGIEVDTGQILPLDIFLDLYSRSKFATPLDNPFLFRDKETEDLLSSIEHNDFTIISGPAGIGKSKIAIECYKQFIDKNKTYEGYCIFNQGVDLFEDLKTYFSDSKDYVIFVDDANRVSGFHYIVDLVNRKRDDQNFKVIVTTRDYALENVRSACRKIDSVSEVHLKALTDEEIKGIIKEEYQISNCFYIERVVDISQGNPRLAMMAAKIAKENKRLESLNDVTAIYDEYYSTIKSDLDAFQDDSIMKVLGVISFYRIVDKTNDKLMSEINDIFGITDHVFWDSAKILHDSEFLDLYEDEIVKVSDQVLSTYFFYLVFIKDKKIDLCVLLTDLFPGYKNRLVDSINPIVNTLNYQQVKVELLKSVDKVWDEIQRNNESTFHDLIDVFWFLKPTETLAYIQGLIQKEAKNLKSIEEINFKPANESNMPGFISTLSLFRFLSESEIKISIDLLLEYIERKPEFTPSLLNYLINRYGFQPESLRSGYLLQRILVSIIVKRCQAGKNEYFARLLIALSEYYLKTHFESARNIKNETVQIIRFDLAEVHHIYELRKTIWESLFECYKIPRLREYVTGSIYSYVEERQNLTVGSIIENDSKYLVPFLQSKFQKYNIYHCLIIQKYTKILDGFGINYDESLKTDFAHYALTFYDLFENRLERIEFTLEPDEYKIQNVISLCGDLKREAYKRLFSDFYDILKIKGDRHKWVIDHGCTLIFDELLGRDIKLFEEVVKDYLAAGDYLNINAADIVNRLISSIGNQSTFDMISSQNFSKKDRWLFLYFRELPKEDIKEEDTEVLLSLYKNANQDNFISSLEYLLKYEGVKKGFIIKVFRIILDRNKDEDGLIKYFEGFFMQLSEFVENMFDIFKEEIDVFEEFYFAVCKKRCHVDYNASIFSKFIDNDLEFIDRYITNRYSVEKSLSMYDYERDYSLLWERHDYLNVMKKITKLVFEKDIIGYSFSYINAFFNKGANPQKDQKIIERQDLFIENQILDNIHDIKYLSYLFNIVSDWKSDRKFKFYKIFLSKNTEYAEFEKLPFTSSSRFWSGSEVPVLSEEVVFFEQIKSLCDSVALLKHRLYIEKRIKGLREQIQSAKKREFIEDW